MTIYQGRFAPSPTGPLHFGSLVAAAGSYLHARQRQGGWQVRIDDIDAPRTVPGASEAILKTLYCFGMRWDGEVVYQNRRISAYQSAFSLLENKRLVYPCACPRKRTAGRAYDGRCRAGLPQGARLRAFRVRTDAGHTGFIDELQGEFGQNLETETGDFIVKRADGLFAYQLAVAVDDAAQGITCVVRGADLLDSTPRQIYLQNLLALPTPAYCHLPVIVDAQGHKLSKQNHAAPVDDTRPLPLLVKVLEVLGQQPPKHLAHSSLPRFWEWAISHWNVAKISRVYSISAF
ncbi:MAG: tRNA glutamyl-Q(34) synthetase GluQRS [Gammaproteobacteria bacterium]|nr:tRNA glutamyl-Q(34) synthetase GluQRS [Gammaproteobacteria bacterium]